MAVSAKTLVAANTAPEVASGLSKLLADSYALYLKTHGYHWNVRGPHFAALHALFMTQYTALWTALDEIAERIRALGELAPMGYGAFSNLSSLRDGDPTRGWREMVGELIEGHRAVCKTAHTAFEAAEAAGDQPTMDLIIQRLQAHEKDAWMLGALLQD